MTLKEFNNNYIYKLDKNYDDWSVITPSSDGKYRGDCESFALTVRKLFPEYSHCKIYGNKINGNGHVILVNEDTNEWIDCNTKEWRPLGTYPEGYSKPIKLYWIGETFMILKGKFFSLFYKDN